jgi:hypothetical protein
VADRPTAPTVEQAPGPLLFARYAFPPNSHGYCGPADHEAFFEYGVSGVDAGLRALARQFEGAWPYLELIAGATGVDDPLDRRVVEAYWVGSPRLDRVGTRAVGDSVEDRFKAMAGSGFSALTGTVLAGGVPHHSFAVFCVYPWTGLLLAGRGTEHALHVLDRCRIRWGEVLAVQGDQVAVRSSPLTWDGRRLGLGEPVTETAVRSVDGVGMVADLAPGDQVSLHWEWVCDRLSAVQVRWLERYTRRHLRIVNDATAHPASAHPLGS